MFVLNKQTLRSRSYHCAQWIAAIGMVTIAPISFGYATATADQVLVRFDDDTGSWSRSVEEHDLHDERVAEIVDDATAARPPRPAFIDAFGYEACGVAAESLGVACRLLPRFAGNLGDSTALA
jgi:hypothetical protein